MNKRVKKQEAPRRETRKAKKEPSDRKVRAGEERIEREARIRSRRRVRPIVIIFAFAVLLTVLTVLYTYFSLGARYLIYSNGTKFLGRCADGVPIVGTVYYTDGNTARYDAQTNTLTYQNGDSYVGELKDFLRHGQGILVTKLTGDKYEGEFVDNQPHGRGKSLFANGDIYEGDFVNGRREGQGTYTWASGATYVGGFKDNLKDGDGFYTAADGATYEGQYVADLKHGEGLFRFASGDTYRGTYVNDVRTGYGEYTWANGETYKGNFVKNKIDTRLLDEEGNFIIQEDGSYAHGEEGVYTWPSEANPDEPKTFTGYFENNTVARVKEEAIA